MRNIYLNGEHQKENLGSNYYCRYCGSLLGANPDNICVCKLSREEISLKKELEDLIFNSQVPENIIEMKKALIDKYPNCSVYTR